MSPTANRSVSWEESDVKRDALGRFARFASGGAPQTDYVDDPAGWCNEQFSPETLEQSVKDTYREYKGKHYVTVNNGLRGRSDLSEDDARIANELSTLMDHNRTTEDVWVTRALKPECFGDRTPADIVGSTFIDPGFMSTTLNEELPAQFLYHGKRTGGKYEFPIMLRLKVPAGTPAYGDAGGDVLKENELTLAPGRSIDFTGVRQTGDGRWEVFGEVASEKSPPPPTVHARQPEDGKDLRGDDLFEYITGKPRAQSSDEWGDFTGALKADGSIFSRIDEQALEELWTELAASR